MSSAANFTDRERGLGEEDGVGFLLFLSFSELHRDYTFWVWDN